MRCFTSILLAAVLLLGSVAYAGAPTAASTAEIDRINAIIKIGATFNVDAPVIAAAVANDKVTVEDFFRSVSGQAHFEGPDEVAVSTPVWFTVEGAEGDYTVTFIPSDEIEYGQPHITDTNALFWSDTPGDYVLSAVVVNWDTREACPLTKTITVLGDKPNPNPQPDPEPQPTPVNELIGLVLYERPDFTAEQARVIDGDRIEVLDPDRFFWQPVDVRTEGRANLQTWIDYAEGNNLELPHIFFIGDGELVKEMPVPSTDDGVDMVIEVVNSLLGKEG